MSAGFLSQLFSGANGRQASAHHYADAIGHLLSHAKLMGRKEDGGSAAGALLQNVLDHARVLRVKADHRFVNNQDLRVV